MDIRFYYSEKLKVINALLKRYWLMVFYITAIAYLELLYRLWCFKSIDAGFVFAILFAVCTGAFLFVLSSAFRGKASSIISVAFTAILTAAYGTQLIYFSIFDTPLLLYSLSGAAEAMQFTGIMLKAVAQNGIGVVLVFLPLILLFVLKRNLPLFQIRTAVLLQWLIFCYISFGFAVICVNLTGDRALSQRSLYYEVSEPRLSVEKLGLLTTMRLDLQRLVFGFEQSSYAEEAFNQNGNNIDINGKEESSIDNPVTEPPIEYSAQPEEFNMINIDFEALIANEKNKELLDLHKYFSSVKPTEKSQYTGMFKGDNLILITAEGFSPYALSPELTPTLYNMSTQGFVFRNFYNPLWNVSTSDGEYAACTGLIPKAGIWSFYRSGRNYMPFAMGNQFKKLGYTTKAFHDHTYTYYKRNISHPNMGYDFKAVGNGLQVKKTWPESDLEMMEVTAPEYVGSTPFHTYYMTVSGHMNYAFGENQMAYKNRALVRDLPYSEPAQAYVACNLELEHAMKALIDKLEAAGIADKTVIAISPDHYPYGLPKKNIDELAGHKVEENFELYRSTLILWKKGMEPIVVEKPCSSIDIIPTLSNLFGLEYDSRLLAGRDILSDAPALVIFNNRSWITDKASYNSAADKATFADGAVEDAEYIKEINNIVEDKFKYSAKILEKDYYNIVVPK